MQPKNVITAATHPDPYPFYAGLVKENSLTFDKELRLWVAANSAIVTEVFANPDCAVRPIAEKIPKAIINSSAGQVFGYLMRMNEGSAHSLPKLAMQRALSSVDLAKVKHDSLELARALALSRNLGHPNDLVCWMHEAPIFAMARLLGFGDARLPLLSSWMADFVACLSPLSSAQQIQDAGLAAACLLDQFKALLRTGPLADGTLAARVKAEAELAGWNSVDSLLANLIGLLSQTYEATAGLIGNTLVALATQPRLEEALRGSPESLPGAVEEVSRFDPPVQNTRRFVTQSTCIAGRQLHPGDVIVLVLAAANRDPALNGRPHEFVPDRPDRRILGFGHGRHACPGQLLAGTIAASAIEVAMDSLSTSEITSLEWQYRPSVNGRIPLFRNPETIKE